ncbi:response regulator [Flavisolibacter nicotianae]|uniref:response regulator n=1 Tax=Flavisolibacter nicotianae TaxID=2364882 RepID=UPI000EAC91EF|nr:response regulator transcription factor [Flavisolibacter nicotianae]
MQVPIRLLIADDHPVFIEGFLNILQAHSNYEVVATAVTGDEVLRKIAAAEPHIALLDVNMPNTNGLELVKKIKRAWPATRIILITMYMPADIGVETRNEEIDGYILKNSGSQVILDALDEVKNGEKYFDPNIESFNHHTNDHFPKQLKLSSREKEILQLIRAGHSNKEIAARLYLSELTIKTHRKNIMKKMGARNLAELLRT